MPELSSVTAISLGCSDPAKLATFYQQATGAQLVYAGDTSTYLTGSGDIRIGFDKVDDYQPPAWPRETLPPVRLDLTSSDLARDEERLRALGATRPGHRLDTDRWIFMADPEGHIFSLTTVY